MYLLIFGDGTRKKVKDEYGEKILNLWEDENNRKKIIKFNDGSRILLSTLVEANPYSNGPRGDDWNAPDKNKVMGYLEVSKTNKPSEKKEHWFQIIRENLRRLEKHLPWIYYDKDFNVCTKEEARLSFGIDDLSNRQPLSKTEKIAEEVDI